ncbi:UNVERIFIED_CONTAM: hypothetical protein GTU68_015115, partial [Idotea baltica]|nr:hypothetical protein [Idotea baltica]
MNFVHSFPYTCVSIALWVNKTAEIGIVYNPNLEQFFSARRGKGAYLNNERIKVSGQTDLSQALVFTEVGTRSDEKKMEIIYRNLQKIMKEAHGIRSMGSAALNMSYVALGGIEAYYEIGIHAWDMAAGALIVTEAGGYVCDVNGVYHREKANL